jgi:hypothetical protein
VEDFERLFHSRRQFLWGGLDPIGLNEKAISGHDRQNQKG